MKVTVKTAAAPAQKTFFKSFVIALLAAAGAMAAAVAAKAGVGTPSIRVRKIEPKAGIAKSFFLIFSMAQYMLSIS